MSFTRQFPTAASRADPIAIRYQPYNTSFSGRIKAFSEIMTGATLFLQVVSYERCFDVEQLSEVTDLVLLLHFFPRVKD